MGFLRKIIGGAQQPSGPPAPRRPEPDTVDAAEFAWQVMQDLVDEFNKGGPSGSLVGLPLQRRVKLRDDISAIGERLGTNRAKVKSRQPEYTSQTAGGLCRNLASLAADDPYGALPFDPADASSPSIADRCAKFADEVEALEKEVDHERKLEHDRRRLS